MGPLTQDRPKCLLPIGGRPLLEHTVKNLRSLGCEDIFVVTGYRGDLIDLPGIRRIENREYLSNNILHSLMHAREVMTGPMVVTYSDIWVEPWIYSRLMDTPGDIVIAADTDWQSYYDGRTDHPISQAENVLVDGDGRMTQIGKHLNPGDSQEGSLSEFLGLWRMSAAGTKQFCSKFLALDLQLDPQDPFQRAVAWSQAYVTDLFQELADNGSDISCAFVERGWAELDTRQDVQRLPQIAERQRLTTIVEFEGAA